MVASESGRLARHACDASRRLYIFAVNRDIRAGIDPLRSGGEQAARRLAGAAERRGQCAAA